MEHKQISQVGKVIAQKCNSSAKLQRSNLDNLHTNSALLLEAAVCKIIL